ncbi:MAG TPA: hypothetical protein VKC53_01390 [Patescibacteria group bacterium]|nr:hypothetical protein [Patescibacteria group bacterium]
MKNFLKNLLKKNNILIIVILILASFVRFYNYPNRVTFWSEQARSLIVSANYIKVKPSLLGQEYFRQDSNSHVIYSGALFNYSLVPLLLISDYNPIIITIFFTFLNLFTGIIIYLVIKKTLGEKLALASTFLFLFNDFMIYHSLFIWSYNYLPLIGILIFYFSYLNFQKEKFGYVFLLGLLSGVGIGLQVLFAPIAIFVLLINIWKSKNKLKSIIFFASGIIVGNLPLVIFDLRHNFYQTRTIFQYFIDTLQHRSDANFNYYYLLSFWPIAAILGGILLVRLFKWNKIAGAFFICLYLFLSLSSYKVSFNSPTGMPNGLKVSDIDNASKIIANDTTGDFNVSEVLDFDKRAYVLRYYLEFKYGKNLLSEIDYPNANVIYALSQKGYNFDSSGIWEISSGGARKVIELSNLGDGYALYKLEK